MTIRSVPTLFIECTDKLVGALASALDPEKSATVENT
jgi:hypothetical protein